jgi:hypothetical protein
MKKLFTVFIAAMVCLPLFALAQEEQGYYSRSYARVNSVSGDVYIQRPGNLGFEAASINLAISEGDKLGTREGRVEIQFGGGNYLRADRSTQVEFAKLPHQQGDPYKLHLLSGSIFLRVGSMDTDKAFEIHSPDASFYVLEAGLYRLNLIGDKQTELQVISGSCEAAGEGGSVVVKSQEHVIASNGQLRSNPQPFVSNLDEFARWNESRDSLLAQNNAPSQSYLPSELDEYASELDENGTWNYEPTYGFVWIPRITYEDWRPYYYGHWVWYPIIGWTWVSDEPWGWCTYHYGRWGWRYDWGWYWIPMSYWGPAWVSWWWDYDYIGWCPMNYYNRPCFLRGHNFYYDHWGRDFYCHENRALTVIHKNQLQSPHADRFALNQNSLSHIGQISMTNGSPHITPTVDRTGQLSREAQSLFSSRNGRPVVRAFGTDGSVRGPLAQGQFNTSTSNGGVSTRGSSGTRGSLATHPSLIGGTSSQSRDSGGRNIRFYSSRETISGLSSGTNQSLRVEGGRVFDRRSSSSSAIKEYGSRSGSSTIRQDSSSSSSPRTIRRDSSFSGSSSGTRTIREFRSNEASPVSRFRTSTGGMNTASTYSSRYGSSFGTGSSSTYSSKYWSSARSYSYGSPWRSSSSPYYSSRGYSQYYGSSSHSYSAPSYSYRSLSHSSGSSRSYGGSSSYSHSSSGSSRSSSGSGHSSSSSSSHGHR